MMGGDAVLEIFWLVFFAYLAARLSFKGCKVTEASGDGRPFIVLAYFLLAFALFLTEPFLLGGVHAFIIGMAPGSGIVGFTAVVVTGLVATAYIFGLPFLYCLRYWLRAARQNHYLKIPAIDR